MPNFKQGETTNSVASMIDEIINEWDSSKRSSDTFKLKNRVELSNDTVNIFKTQDK